MAEHGRRRIHEVTPCCQLLGMNCNTPTDILFSFEGFHRRGGLTDQHADGFGIAFFEGVGCRLFLDDQASALASVGFDPPLPDQIQNVIAHIRKATQGRVALKTPTRFTASCGGATGFCPQWQSGALCPARGQYYRPVGDTDSEAAFCHLLETLRQRFAEPPPLAGLTAAVRELAASIRAHGVFNFMLSNGDVLFTHCSTHLQPYLVRQRRLAWRTWWTTTTSIDFAEVTTPATGWR